MNRVTAIDCSETAPADQWLTPGRFAAILALFIAAMFPGVLVGSSTFVVRDFGMFSYPVAYFQREAFWRGELPQWNPLNSCGVPFLAQWNTMVFYPPALLYLLFPLAWSLPFFCLLHVFWGGMGMYFLAHRWTQHRLAAGIAGVIFSFNGMSLNFLMWPSHIATFAWLPWMLLLGQRAWLEGGRIMVLAILAAAAQMLAGGPETIASTWIILGLLACGDWICRNGPRAKIAIRYLTMVFLVTMVCAAQLLPFLELVSHSQRDSGYAKSTHDWSMPFWGWANFLVPLFRCTPTAQGVFLQNGQYWTSSYYAGIATVLLVASAIRRVRDWRVLTLIAVVIFALILALGDGTWLFGVLRYCFPGIGFLRYAVKFVILVLALVPLLAAVGFATLTNGKQRLGKFEVVFAAVLILAIGIIVAVDRNASLTADLWKALWQSGASRAIFLIVTCLAIAALLKADGGRRILIGCFLLCAFWLDFVTHVPNQNPGAKPFIYNPGWVKTQLNLNPWPELGKSRAMISPATLDVLKYNPLPSVDETYLRNRLALRVDVNLLDGIPQIDGFFSLIPREIFRVTSIPYDQPKREFPALLDFLAVSQATVLETNMAWQSRSTAMSFISIGQRPEYTDDTPTFDALSQPNVDFRTTVFLPRTTRGVVSTNGQPAASVTKSEFGNEEIKMHTESPTPALVVISQTYYPAWKAYVDGAPTTVWRSNYAFQALQVPAGSHNVRLVYQDNKLKIGGLLSLLGLAVLAAMWWRAPRGFKSAEVPPNNGPQSIAASATTQHPIFSIRRDRLPDKPAACCSHLIAGSESN